MSENYFINQELIEEMIRLKRQAHLNTVSMGGALPEPMNVEQIHDVLDLACGPGEWFMNLVTEFPQMRAIGVDLSRRMVEYAQVQAEAKNLPVMFHIMDILKPLDFPDASFDLVNTRFITGFMKKEQWPLLLNECFRVLRPGGIIRVTEQEGGFTNDPIMQQYLSMGGRAWKQAGHSFSHSDSYFGITVVLKYLMREAGFMGPKLRPVMIDLSTGEPNHQEDMENLLAVIKLARPFLLKTGAATPTQLDDLREGMQTLVNKAGFCATWLVQTAWALKPS